MRKNGDAVAQQISLVHEVGCEENGPLSLVLEQHIPSVTALVWIHAWTVSTDDLISHKPDVGSSRITTFDPLQKAMATDKHRF